MMDYAHRRRVKIWGEASVVEDDPALMGSLMPRLQGAPRTGDHIQGRGVGHQLPAAHPAEVRCRRRRGGAGRTRCADCGTGSGTRGIEGRSPPRAHMTSSGFLAAASRQSPDNTEASSDRHRPSDCGISRSRSRRVETKKASKSRPARQRRWHRCRRFIAHQIGLVPKLNRQRKQRAQREVDILVRRVTAEAAQQIILGDPELRVLASFSRRCSGAPSKKCAGPLAKFSGSTQRAPTSAQ